MDEYIKMISLDAEEYNSLDEKRKNDGNLYYLFDRKTKKYFSKENSKNKRFNAITVLSLVFAICIIISVTCLVLKIKGYKLNEVVNYINVLCVSYMTSFVFYCLTIQLPAMITKNRIKYFIKYKTSEIISDMNTIMKSLLIESGQNINKISEKEVESIGKVDLESGSFMRNINCITNESASYLIKRDLFICSVNDLKEHLKELVFYHDYYSFDFLYLLIEISNSEILKDEFLMVIRGIEKIDFSRSRFLFTDFFESYRKLESLI